MEQQQVSQNDWIYDYEFLKNLTYKVNGSDHGEGLCMEEVESVLLAINYPTSPLPASSSIEGQKEEKDFIEFAEWANDNFGYVEKNKWEGYDDETFSSKRVYYLFKEFKATISKEDEK